MEFPQVSNKTVLAHFLTHPHGRRMVAAGFHLLSKGKWPIPFSLLFEHTEFEKEMRPLLKGALSPVFAFRGILDEGTDRFVDSSSDFVQALIVLGQNPKGWSAREEGLQTIDLMSPVLTEQAIRDILSYPDISREAQVALSANSNCPSELAISVCESGGVSYSSRNSWAKLIIESLFV